MLKSFIKASLLSACLISSVSVEAKSVAKVVGAVPLKVDVIQNVDNPKFNPLKEEVFDIKEYTNDSKVSIFAVTNDYGTLQIETDVLMKAPLQGLPVGEERDMLLAYGHELTTYILRSVYGVPNFEIKVGDIFIGKPSSAPEGNIMIIDTIFRRDGKLYNARVGIWTADIGSNKGEHQIMFIYPTH